MCNNDQMKKAKLFELSVCLFTHCNLEQKLAYTTTKGTMNIYLAYICSSFVWMWLGYGAWIIIYKFEA